MTGIDDTAVARERRRRAIAAVVASTPVEPALSTLSASSMDGDGQHSGRSRVARLMERMAQRGGGAVTVPAVAVEDLIRPTWFAGPPAMIHVHLYAASAAGAALTLEGGEALLVVASVPELRIGDAVLAVLQLPNGVFLQLPAVVVRQGVHRLQLALPGLTAASCASLVDAVP